MLSVLVLELTWLSGYFVGCVMFMFMFIFMFRR